MATANKRFVLSPVKMKKGQPATFATADEKLMVVMYTDEIKLITKHGHYMMPKHQHLAQYGAKVNDKYNVRCTIRQPKDEKAPVCTVWYW